MTRPGRPTTPATQRALDRIRQGANPHAAAKAEGVHPSTVYRALAKLRAVK
jgi:transposase